MTEICLKISLNSLKIKPKIQIIETATTFGRARHSHLGTVDDIIKQAFGYISIIPYETIGHVVTRSTQRKSVMLPKTSRIH